MMMMIPTIDCLSAAIATTVPVDQWEKKKPKQATNWLPFLKPLACLALSTSQSSDKLLACVGSQNICALYLSEGCPKVCFWQIQWGIISWQYKLMFLDATERFKRNLWRVRGALGFIGDERSASSLCAAGKECFFPYISVRRMVCVGICSNNFYLLLLMTLLSVLAFAVCKINKRKMTTASESTCFGFFGTAQIVSNPSRISNLGFEKQDFWLNIRKLGHNGDNYGCSLMFVKGWNTCTCFWKKEQLSLCCTGRKGHTEVRTFSFLESSRENSNL